MGQYGQAPKAVGTSYVLEFHPWTSKNTWKASKLFRTSILSPWQIQRDTITAKHRCLTYAYRAPLTSIWHHQGLWWQNYRHSSWTREPTCAIISLPIFKKIQRMWKSAHLIRKETPTQTRQKKKWAKQAILKQGHQKREEAELTDAALTALSLGDPQNVRKDFSHCPGEHTYLAALRLG